MGRGATQNHPTRYTPAPHAHARLGERNSISILRQCETKDFRNHCIDIKHQIKAKEITILNMALNTVQDAGTRMRIV